VKTIDVNLLLGRPGTHVGGVARAGELLAEMDRRSIEKGLVAHLAGAWDDPYLGNDLLLQEVRDVGNCNGRLVPVPVVDVDASDGGVDWDAWQEAGCKAVRVCPTFYRRAVDAGACERWLTRLLELKWFLEVPIYPFAVRFGQTGTVADAMSFAESHVDLPVLILAPHRYMFGEICSALASHSNIYLDVGNLSGGGAVTSLIAEGFSDRLVCGSGYGVCYSTPFRDMVLYSNISESAKRRIVYDNANRLLAGRMPD